MSLTYPNWLYERAFGGAGVAATPVNAVNGGNWPEGPAASHVNTAVERLIESCRDQSGTRPCQVFLVGGAGNGKSYLAAQIVGRAGATNSSQRKKHAQRTYIYETPSKRILRVVNDATIPPDQPTSAALRDDLSRALTNEEHLLVCANRGVLIGEIRDAAKESLDGVDAASATLIAALLDGADSSQRVVSGWKIEREKGTSLDCIRFVLTAPNGVEFDVHVVFMDHVSLLEPMATTSSAQDDRRESPVAPIRDPDQKWRPRDAAFERPLKQVASSVIREMDGAWPGGDLDPIRANVSNFLEDRFSDAWCRCMRAVEVSAGFNFSYRDLWGLAVLSVIGPMPLNELGQRAQWVKDRVREFDQAADDVRRCRALISLAQMRSHVTLFGGLPIRAPLGGESPCDIFVPSDAASAACSADPLLDVHTETSIFLQDALSRVQEGEPAGPRIKDASAQLRTAWSPLEQNLDEVIARLMHPMDQSLEVDRPRLLSWYSQYLHRLHGLACGLPAFSDVVVEWQDAQRRALEGRLIGSELERALIAVILPTTVREKVLLPIMKSRVTGPFTGESHVAIELEPREFFAQVRLVGDRLVLVLGRHGSDEKAETSLDFHLVREALSQTRGLGFTDSLRYVEPRLERMRAKIVSLSASGDRRTRAPLVFISDEGEVVHAR